MTELAELENVTNVRSPAASKAQVTPDFSLVTGGLCYRLLCALGILKPPLKRLPRWILAVILITWLPPCLWAIASGSSQDALPFFHDIQFHVRFLIALPVLIAAEVLVHARIAVAVKQFAVREIVASQDLPLFNRAVNSSIRLRDSAALEISLLLVIYVVDLWLLFGNTLGRIALGRNTWYALRQGSAVTVLPVGYWYALVSLPIYQFIILRWYVRLFIWFQLLWRIARLNLRLDPAHSDRAGGLGFVGISSYAFGPILFAQGALLSGTIANRIFYEGKRLVDFKVSAAILILCAVLCVLLPALVFVPRLADAKRRAWGEYGELAARYMRRFHEKWIAARIPPGEELLGTPDIQSLADITNGYNVVSNMRPIPFGMRVVLALIAITVAPLLPLTLTVVPLETIIDQLIKSLL